MLRVGVLGPLVVAVDGVVVHLPAARERAVLSLLAVRPGEPWRADALAEVLWSEEPPATWDKTLATYVYRLRRRLGSAASAVQTVGQGYVLVRDDVEVDAEVLRRAVAAGGASEVVAAVAAWRGTPLDDLDGGALVLAERQALHDLRVRALVLALGDGGQAAEAMPHAERALLDDPWHEPLWAAAVAALGREGRPADARAAYERAVASLAEVGAGPSPALTGALVPTAPEALAPRPLPVPLTRLFGRAELVAEVRTRLAEHRLVTLTGAGGAGKSRVALAAVAGGEGPVVHVDLGTMGPGSLEAAVARSAGLAGTAVGEVLAALGGAGGVLLLDAAEHRADEVAELVSAGLAAEPGLRFLVTSREPLRLPGELRLEVGPLDDEAAMSLLADRAALVGATVPPEVLASTRRLCELLDRLPLALELAGAALADDTVDGLRARLEEDALAPLGPAPRGVPERQTTLLATIAWSYDRLAPDDRSTLRALGLVPGSFDRTLAAALCGDEVRSALARLSHASLVRRVGERWVLLDTVRAAAVGWLTDDERAAVAERLVAWAAAFRPVVDAEDWHRLRADLATMRAAVELAAGLDATVAARILRNVAEPLASVDPTAGVDLAALVVRLAPSRHPGVPAALALGAGFARVGGDLRTARELAGRAHSLACDLDDRDVEREASRLLGIVEAMTGDLRGAQRRFEDLWSDTRPGDDDQGIVLNALGNVTMLGADFVAARAWFVRWLEHALAKDDRMSEVQARINLAAIDLDEGRLDEAWDGNQAALVVMEDFGDLEGTTTVLVNLALVAYEREDDVAALELAERGADVAGAHGFGHIAAMARSLAASLAGPAAAGALVEAIDDLAAVGDRSLLEGALRRGLSVLVGVGDLDRARAAAAVAGLGPAPGRLGRVLGAAGCEVGPVSDDEGPLPASAVEAVTTELRRLGDGSPGR